MRHHLLIAALAFAAALLPVRVDAQLASAAAEELARVLQKAEGAAAISSIAPLHVAAQVPSSPFAKLRGVITPGQTLVLTDVTGRRTTGKLADLSDAWIALDVRGGRVRFDAANVRRIERVADRFWDTPLIATGIGAGVGGIADLIERRGRHPSTLQIDGIALMFGTMIGAAVGSIAEAVVDGRELVYSQPRAPFLLPVGRPDAE